MRRPYLDIFVSLRLSMETAIKIDLLIEKGLFASRSEALREFAELFLSRFPENYFEDPDSQLISNADAVLGKLLSEEPLPREILEKTLSDLERATKHSNLFLRKHLTQELRSCKAYSIACAWLGRSEIPGV